MSILRDWSQKLRACTSDQRGAVAVIFGIMAIPVMGLVGASLDYSRAANVQTQLQGAIDAAVLSTAQMRDLTDEQIEQELRAQIMSMVDGAHGADGLTIDVSRNNEDSLLDISASMDIETSLLSLIGIRDITIAAGAAVGTEVAAMEVALVLDNTGSMRHQNRIGALRGAANLFLDIVSDEGEADNLKIALVPYTAQVNIGNTTTMEQFLDQEGLSTHHAQLIEGRRLGRLRNCGTIPAEANDTDAYSYVVRGCDVYNPDQISHWQLYQQLDGVEWKGCVEARPEPFDVTDDLALDSDPDTLWVPAFWIDDISWRDTNDWLPDRDPPGVSFDRQGDIYNVFKYRSSANNDVDEVPNSTLGPAKNCGDPIVPLTDNFEAIGNSIDNMTYWNSGGTVTAQGVVWGWRTLSPRLPFNEGAPYDEVTKVMVVMTDGRNELVSTNNGYLRSHYSGYGHARHGRFPGESVNSGLNYINARTLEACRNAKAAGVVIYTVTLGLSSDARALWDQCATTPDYASHVNAPSELEDAFGDIAASVGELRLTR